MISNALKLLAVAGLAAVAGSSAFAQNVPVRVGPDRVERRIVRPVPRPRVVCRTAIRERVVRFVRRGEVVRRVVRTPVRVCTVRPWYRY